MVHRPRRSLRNGRDWAAGSRGGALRTLAWLAAWASVAACTGNASSRAPAPGPAEATCWDPAEDHRGAIASPRDARDRLVAVARAHELRELHETVGWFSRGRRPLYTGTLRARDNFGAQGGNAEDGVLADGPVWAVVLREPPHPGAPPPNRAELVIVSESQQKTLRLWQQRSAPRVTEFAHITPPGTQSGGMARCRDCLPDLFEPPPRLPLPSVEATRRFDRYQARVTAHGVLHRVAPAAITLEQIRRAHRLDGRGREAIVDQLTLRAGALVRAARGLAEEPADEARSRAPEGFTRCRHQAEYSAQWWIDPACLGRFGVRDIELGAVRTRCCVPARGGDALPRCVDLP